MIVGVVCLWVLSITYSCGDCFGLILYRKTQVGNIEIKDIRPPRFIGKDRVGALLIECNPALCDVYICRL